MSTSASFDNTYGNWSAAFLTSRQSDAPSPVACVRCANGRELFVDPDDGRGQYLLARGGSAEPSGRSLWQKLALEGSWTHIVDVGANYGEMILGVDLPPDAEIVAVEPNTRLLPYLRHGLRTAGIRATIVPKALAATAGTVELLADRTWSGMSRLTHVLAPERPGHVLEPLETQATTLSALLAGGGAKRVLLKIDVEGCETDVLRGLNDAEHSWDDFAAMIEILHIREFDLDWLLGEYAIECYAPSTGTLHAFVGDSAAAFHQVIATGNYHIQDVVVRPRADGTARVLR